MKELQAVPENVLRAAASPIRVALLGRLAGGAATVSEMGISQPLTSHHLGQLRGAGLLVATRAGRTVVTYRIADTPLAWSIVGVVRQCLARRDVVEWTADAAPRCGRSRCRTVIMWICPPRDGSCGSTERDPGGSSASLRGTARTAGTRTRTGPAVGTSASRIATTSTTSTTAIATLRMAITTTSTDRAAYFAINTSLCFYGLVRATDYEEGWR